MIKKIRKLLRKGYPNSADAVYIVRDDDRFFVDVWDNAWCTNRVIEAVKAFDEVFLERGIPVSVGVVPKNFDGRDISQEAELVEYLRFLQEKGWEIAQHGNTHLVFTEYPAEEQKKELLEGKQILEKLFGRIKTFIAPKNFWNESLVDSLSKTGYSFLSADGKDSPQIQKISDILAVHKSFNPVVGYREGTLKDVEELNKAFDEVHKNEGVFCNMFHSWVYDSKPDKLRQVSEHLDYVKEKYGKKVWFTTIKGIGEFLR